MTCDPRVEGRFEILMRVGDNEVPHTGSYLEIDRPEPAGIQLGIPGVA